MKLIQIGTFLNIWTFLGRNDDKPNCRSGSGRFLIPFFTGSRQIGPDLDTGSPTPRYNRTEWHKYYYYIIYIIYYIIIYIILFAHFWNYWNLKQVYYFYVAQLMKMYWNFNICPWFFSISVGSQYWVYCISFFTLI